MTKFSATFIQASSFCVSTHATRGLCLELGLNSVLFSSDHLSFCVKWRGHHGKVVHASLVHLLLCAYFRWGLPDEESLVWSTRFLTKNFIQLIMILFIQYLFLGRRMVLFNKDMCHISRGFRIRSAILQNMMPTGLSSSCEAITSDKIRLFMEPTRFMIWCPNLLFKQISSKTSLIILWVIGPTIRVQEVSGLRFEC
jgi:hypothetical protein